MVRKLSIDIEKVALVSLLSCKSSFLNVSIKIIFTMLILNSNILLASIILLLANNNVDLKVNNG